MATINLGKVQGDQGIQGEKGEKGDKGDIGLTGEKGDTGAKGDKGDTGEQGLKGDKGDVGEQGLRGNDGVDGFTTSINVNGKNYTVDPETQAITLPDYPSGGSGAATYQTTTTVLQEELALTFEKWGTASPASTVIVNGKTITLTTGAGELNGMVSSDFMPTSFELSYNVDKEVTNDNSQFRCIYTSVFGEIAEHYLVASPWVFGTTNFFVSVNVDSLPYIDKTKPMHIDIIFQNGNPTALTIVLTNFTFIAKRYMGYPNIKENLDDTLKSLDVATKGSAQGLSMMLLGDSLTAAQGDYAWWYYASKLLGINDITNVAMGGATLRDYPDTVYDGNPQFDNPVNNTIGNQVQKIVNSAYPAPDIIVIGIGLNDIASFEDGFQDFTDEQMASTYYDSSYVKKAFESIDKKTTLGAFRYVHEALHLVYPNAIIVFNSESNTSAKDRDPLKVLDMAEKIERMTRFVSLPFIDAKRSGINWLFENDYPNSGEYLYDGLHHNDKGAKLYGACMAQGLKQIIDQVKLFKNLV